MIFSIVTGLLVVELNRRAYRIAELSRARAEADHARKAKAEFLATMSHELRTPLNGIIGFANLLIETGLDEGQRQHFAKLVRDAGRSLLVIVNDVLDFSKIEAGQLALEAKPLDLSHLAIGCYRLVEHAAAEKGLTLSCDWRRICLPGFLAMSNACGKSCSTC